MKEKFKNTKGITLVALIITIIVLLILAVVAITSIRNSNIIKYAQNGRDMYNHGKEDEGIKLNEYEKYIEDEVIEPISQTESYVGYYADIDKDGTVDGIIYADLAVGGSGQWGDSNGTFSYTAITGTKEYYISNTGYVGKFGTKDVISVVPDSKGADRFYVMALEDVTGTTQEGTTTSDFCWYDAAYDNKISDYSTVTSTSFGAGKTNTSTMISKWNEPAYGNKDDNETYKDMWGVIQDKADKGWFVPSNEEWSAFAQNLGMTENNYRDYGVLGYYWSSSLLTTSLVWLAGFGNGFMDCGGYYHGYHVRLSATF